MNRHHPPAPEAPLPGIAQRVLAPLERFLQVEAASGTVLLLAAAAALAWANSPWASSYDAFWHAPITLGLGELVVARSLHFWINEGLMTIFFLVVGLEIRREMHEGALSDWKFASLPLVAALGGVIVPALIYLLLNGGPEVRQGWAVPTATDIAFAVGVLTLLGKRVPSDLRVLLLALAIIDDIAAILLIAVYYSTGIEGAGLLLAGVGVGLVLLFQRLGFRSAWSYVLPGAVVWLGMLRAGLHPTLAGVVLGLLTPVTTAFAREGLLATAARALEEFRERSRRHGTRHAEELVPPLKQLRNAHREMLPPVIRVQVALHPWVAYGVMPLFALANAGVRVEGTAWASESSAMVMLGVTLGLVLGKPLGVLAASALGVRFGICSLPPGIHWRAMLLMGGLAGIGFTLSIFIATLAFEGDAALLSTAKLGVLVGSAVAATLGLVFSRFLLPVQRAEQDAP